MDIDNLSDPMGEIRDIKRRIAALERQSILASSSIRDGCTQLYDANSNVIAQLGNGITRGVTVLYQDAYQNVTAIYANQQSQINAANARMNPGGDVNNFISAVSNVAWDGVSRANAAQGTANDAWNRANNAQSTANGAQSSANNAYSLAQSAYNRASQAIDDAAAAWNRAGSALTAISYTQQRYNAHNHGSRPSNGPTTPA